MAGRTVLNPVRPWPYHLWWALAWGGHHPFHPVHALLFVVGGGGLVGIFVGPVLVVAHVVAPRLVPHVLPGVVVLVVSLAAFLLMERVGDVAARRVSAWIVFPDQITGPLAERARLLAAMRDRGHETVRRLGGDVPSAGSVLHYLDTIVWRGLSTARAADDMVPCVDRYDEDEPFPPDPESPGPTVQAQVHTLVRRVDESIDQVRRILAELHELTALSKAAQADGGAGGDEFARCLDELRATRLLLTGGGPVTPRGPAASA